MSSRWTLADLPDQSGRVAVVTGANSGLGLAIAGALAGAGARVVMACRNEEKAEAAAGTIRARAPRGTVEVRRLDLADLGSVTAFSDAFLGAYEAAAKGTAAWVADAGDRSRLLRFHLLTRALYEIVYEANNRPDWIGTPARGVIEILETKA